MSEYGNGISMKQKFEFDRERIEHALKCELMCGETEKGFEYAPCTKEEADAYILSAYDSAVYWCLQANKTSRCLDEIIRENNLMDDSSLFQEFIVKMNESYGDLNGNED